MSRDKGLNIFLFAGEPSGDLHGSALLRELRLRLPQASFCGVPGPKMRAQGIVSLLPMEAFQVMGFSDVWRALPALWSYFGRICSYIVQRPIDLVVLIDYPGFNLRLAKALRKCGYRGKIVHYISPTVWAWRKGRINTMADNLDLLLTIYPFEAECYAQTSLPVEFVGHPLTERLHSYSYNEEWQRLLKIPDDGPLVALFPGSRVAEVARNLPLQLQAAEQLAARRGKRIFGLSCGNAEVAAEVERVLSEVGSPLKIGRELFLVPTEFSYELMRDAHCAIAKSGTVTLELALHHCPSVVVYNLSAFNRFIAKRIFRLSLANYCIVNILAEERVFPELIEHGCSAHNAAQWLEELDAPSAARNRALAGCKRIAELLAISNGSQRAAQAIVEQIR